jgi:hypothetical protein
LRTEARRAGGPFGRRRLLEGHLPAGQRLLGPDDPLGYRRLPREEPAGDLLGGQAAEQAQGKRDPGLGGQHRMAGDEHQPQQVIVDLPLAQHVVELRRDTVLPGFQLAAEQAQLAAEPFVPPDPVDGSVLSGEHEPGAGVGRNALGGPLFQRGDQGILGQFLGQADVPDQPGQACGDPG